MLIVPLSLSWWRAHTGLNNEECYVADVTVKQFAQDIGVSVDRLLTQLGEAGLTLPDADHSISDDQKQQFLHFLKNKHGQVKDSDIFLRKRKTGEISGVKVMVRKKRKLRPRVAVDPSVTDEPEKAEETTKPEALLAVKTEDTPQAPKKKAAAFKPSKPSTTSGDKDKQPGKPDKKRRDKPSDRDSDKRKESKKSKNRSEKFSVPKHNLIHFDDDQDDYFGGRRRKGPKKSSSGEVDHLRHEFTMPTERTVHEVIVPESISVAELAQRMSVKAAEVIKVMFNMGAMATINQVLDQDTAAIVVEEMGHAPKLVHESAVEDALRLELQHEGELHTRPPVVTIMGHVDHGKTSLLDYIRRTKVTDNEAGGITQHIGAYHVETDRGVITFLDTPGHAAFTAMRARGAKSTDIVVLVVAADDGVMPQTLEAIQHAKAGNAPILVAINKIDKPDADPEKIKAELSNHGVIGEEWGGDALFVNVSAKTGEGVDALLEAILIQAEMLELQAIVDCPASGVVIEAKLDKGRGAVASILVGTGTLKKGDIVLVGLEYGRVRALLDENGHAIDAVGPSLPVEILGLSKAPRAGDELTVVSDERKAREVALFRQGQYRKIRLNRKLSSNFENVFDQVSQNNIKSLYIVLKAAEQGSVEALTDALTKLSNDEIKIKVVFSGVGGIAESDVNLAIASSAIMIGFNVRADASAKQLIAKEDITVHYYSVIYDIIDVIKRAMHGMLGPVLEERIIGLAEVRDVYRSSKLGAVAGCIVSEGTIKRNKPIRVLRQNVVVFEGQLESLRRHKDDVPEVRSGTECGIGVKSYNDIKVKDQIEVFEKVEVQRSL